VNRTDPMGTDWVWASSGWIRIPPYIDEGSTAPSRTGIFTGEIVLERYRGVDSSMISMLQTARERGMNANFEFGERGLVKRAWLSNSSVTSSPTPQSSPQNSAMDVIDTFGDFGNALQEVVAGLPQTAPTAIKQAASDFVDVNKRIAHIEEQIGRVSNIGTDSKSASAGILNLAMELEQARAAKDGLLTVLRGVNLTRLVPTRLMGTNGVVDEATEALDFMSSLGRRDGALLGATNMSRLKAGMGRWGITITENADDFLAGRGNAAFDPASMTIYLKGNPTRYEVLHEVSHALDFRALGKAEYLAKSPAWRERSVVERLFKSNWKSFSDTERWHMLRHYADNGGGYNALMQQEFDRLFVLFKR